MLPCVSLVYIWVARLQVELSARLFDHSMACKTRSLQLVIILSILTVFIWTLTIYLSAVSIAPIAMVIFNDTSFNSWIYMCICNYIGQVRLVQLYKLYYYRAISVVSS